MDQLTTWAVALAAKGAAVSSYDIGPPASSEALALIARASQRALPAELASILTTVTGRIAFFWELDLRKQDPAVPEPLARFGQIGELAFDVQTMAWLRAVDEVAEDDRYLDESQVDRLRASVEFYRTSTGDIFTVDSRNGAVNYLTYESGFAEAVLLAPSFVEFLERFTSIGCVGPEMWVLELTLGPFGIDPNASLAKDWRAWMGVSHESRVI